MNRDKDAYAAGLIDGEGTISLSRLHRNTERAPVVSFASTSFELISFFRQTYGGSVVTKKVYSNRHTQSWECRLANNAALEFLRLVYPHMRHAIKRRRAKLLLEEYKLVTPRNGKYTTTLRRKKREFERRFFHPSAP